MKRESSEGNREEIEAVQCACDRECTSKANPKIFVRKFNLAPNF